MWDLCNYGNGTHTTWTHAWAPSRLRMQGKRTYMMCGLLLCSWHGTLFLVSGCWHLTFLVLCLPTAYILLSVRLVKNIRKKYERNMYQRWSDTNLIWYDADRWWLLRPTRWVSSSLCSRCMCICHSFVTLLQLVTYWISTHIQCNIGVIYSIVQRTKYFFSVILEGQ